ncbi:hypothetical protein [Nocardia cerradoensis]|uniref:hypothetical protein n=1 Tax=Nocardia cerradoensis TaxID=85688 RepID=UPI00117D35E5|nr:hypothetical protein [Nocardia cerradoensis]
MRAAVMSPVVVPRTDAVQRNVLDRQRWDTCEHTGRDRDPIETAVTGTGVKPVSSHRSAIEYETIGTSVTIRAYIHCHSVTVEQFRRTDIRIVFPLGAPIYLHFALRTIFARAFFGQDRGRLLKSLRATPGRGHSPRFRPNKGCGL